MQKLAALCVAGIAAGCASNTVLPSEVKPPARWLMSPPCKMIDVPRTEGDLHSRVEYYAQSRKCHAATRDKVYGLQRYVRTVRRSK